MSRTVISESEPESRPAEDDWRGAGDLVALAVERIAAPVEGMHRAIVGRWMGLGGPAVEPVRRIVDELTGAIYKTVRLGGGAVGSVIAVGAGLASDRVRLPSVWATRHGRYIQPMLNGLWGDSFDRARSPFGIQLGLRAADGAPIPAEPNSLSRAFPDATTRLVVLLHGLGESERCWLSTDGNDLPSALESDGSTVLSARYNSGRSIADNGSDLADLLESVATSWPVPVASIDLVGHSMGGLVARDAIATARSAEQHWVQLTRHLVAIASPHLGSPIEKGVQFISDGLGLFAETRPLQGFLQQRSVGIKNLRHGVETDESDLGDVQQHYIAATITTNSNHPIGSVLGDLVVRVGSATGRGRSQPLASDVFVVGGRNHASLLRDLDVQSRIRTWLASSQSAQTSP